MRTSRWSLNHLRQTMTLTYIQQSLPENVCGGGKTQPADMMNIEVTNHKNVNVFLTQSRKLQIESPDHVRMFTRRAVPNPEQHRTQISVHS